MILLLFNWCLSCENNVLLLFDDFWGLWSLSNLQLGLAASYLSITFTATLSKLVQTLFDAGTRLRHLLDVSLRETYGMTGLLNIVAIADHATAHG